MIISLPSIREDANRKVCWFLLSVAGLLAGCTTPTGYKPVLPESCTWLKFPYTWMCIDPEEGKAIPKKETAAWDFIPLDDPRCGTVIFDRPLSIEDLTKLETSMLVLGSFEDQIPDLHH